MSTLLELQSQLRRVTEEYHEQMLALTRELTLAAQNAEAGPKQMDFQRLAKLGGSCPLLHRGLQGVDDALRTDYLTFLCAVAQSAPEMEDGWLLLQRIACGVGIVSLEPLAAAAMCLEDDDMKRFSDQICSNGLRDRFLLDAMLLRLACSQPCPKTEELLVDLSALMECPVDDLKFLSKLAVVLARQDGPSYLSMGLELGERDWLGLEYIQDNADILYTDQFSEARKHGFRSVILHDCTIEKEDMPDDCIELAGCCLFQCRFADSAKVTLTHSTASSCVFNFSLPSFNFYLPVQHSARTHISRERKLQLNYCALQNCSAVRFEAGKLADFVAFNNTSPYGIKLRKGKL